VASVDEVGSVVLPDGGRGVLAQRVEEPHGVCLGGELADGGFVGPAEGGDLVVGGELAAGDLARCRVGRMRSNRSGLLASMFTISGTRVTSLLRAAARRSRT
jgi:hypothetical protein